MTLSKAIEILSESANAGMTTFNPDYKEAQKLLIEAGKRIDRQRNLAIPIHQPLLPGETMV